MASVRFPLIQTYVCLIHGDLAYVNLTHGPILTQTVTIQACCLL